MKKFLLLISLIVLVGCTDILAPSTDCEQNMIEIEELYGEPIHIEYLPETYDVRGHLFAGDVVWFYPDGLTITFSERGDCLVLITDRNP